MSALIAATLAVAWLLFSSPAAAGDRVITLDEARAIARDRAPLLIAARARIGEAEGRLAGASAWLRGNPTLEAAAGPRRSSSGDSVDLDIGVAQTFELGGRRAHRIAGAEAEVAGAIAGSDDTLRLVLRDVSVAFLRVLAAQEQRRLAASAEHLAVDLERAAAERFRRGDIAVLDLNLARTALARARSDSRAADAELAALRGALRTQLGGRAEEPLELAGTLRERRAYELDALLAQAAERPDVRQLTAELHAAEAEARLGRATAWPEVGVGAHYKQEEHDDIVLGALSVALPVFARGQELRATGTARALRLRRELETRARAVAVEVCTAFESYRHQVEAVEVLERDALPRLDENEALSQRSYAAGQLSLPELLLIRRETLAARRDYLERLLAAAVAGVELEAHAGVLQ